MRTKILFRKSRSWRGAWWAKDRLCEEFPDTPE